MTDLEVPSANSWLGIRLLSLVLSLTAGSMNVIGLGNARVALHFCRAKNEIPSLTLARTLAVGSPPWN
jgi:hypothetical protein